jgi:hypothetical protein
LARSWTQSLNHFRNGNHGDHHDAMPTWLVIGWLIYCGLYQPRDVRLLMGDQLLTLRQQANRLRGVVGAWSNDQWKWMGT